MCKRETVMIENQNEIKKKEENVKLEDVIKQ